MTESELQEFINSLNPEVRVFLAHLDLILQKIEEIKNSSIKGSLMIN